MAATVSSVVLELPAGGGDAGRGHVAGRRHADLGRKRRSRWRSLMATRVASTAEPVVVGGVGVDQILGPADRLVAGPPAPHRRGELALCAGPAEEHHQPAGDGLGDLDAVVVLDERQRHVDAGGDAGRRPHVAVAGPDRIGVDVDVRVLGGEPRRSRPVRRGPPAVEQPGGGEDERAAADADDPPGPTGQLPDGGDQLGVGGRRVDAGPARHDERVDGDGGIQSGGDELEAALRAHGAGGGAGDLDVVGDAAGRRRPPRR